MSATFGDVAFAKMLENLWLASLDALSLECDGLTRVISALLRRDQVPHSPMAGHLSVPSVGRIDPHCWIELRDGRIIDLRARMWLGAGSRVPHGIVMRDVIACEYVGRPVQLGCVIR